MNFNFNKKKVVSIILGGVLIGILIGALIFYCFYLIKGYDANESLIKTTPYYFISSILFAIIIYLFLSLLEKPKSKAKANTKKKK